MIQRRTEKNAVSANQLACETRTARDKARRLAVAYCSGRGWCHVDVDLQAHRQLGGRGRRHERAEREVILDRAAQAQASGARLNPAYGLLEISARTNERWRADPQAGNRCCGNHRRPSNALSPAEEAQLVTVLTSSRYSGLSPKQLVAQLADEELYLSSESTMSSQAPTRSVREAADDDTHACDPGIR